MVVFIILLWLFLHNCIWGMLECRLVCNLTTGDKTARMMDLKMSAYQLEILMLNVVTG